jgi:hypothetical protein
MSPFVVPHPPEEAGSNRLRLRPEWRQAGAPHPLRSGNALLLGMRKDWKFSGVDLRLEPGCSDFRVWHVCDMPSFSSSSAIRSKAEA